PRRPARADRAGRGRLRARRGGDDSERARPARDLAQVRTGAARASRRREGHAAARRRACAAPPSARWEGLIDGYRRTAVERAQAHVRTYVQRSGGPLADDGVRLALRPRELAEVGQRQDGWPG